MTWEIFLGIVALAGFIITLCSPILKLNTSITKLNETISSLRDIVEKNDEANKQSHQRIYDRLDSHDRTINSHSERISNIESSAERRMEQIKDIEKATATQESRLVHVEANLDSLQKDVIRHEQVINKS